MRGVDSSPRRSTNSSPASPAIAVHERFAQPAFRHDRNVSGKRVEQLVGENHARRPRRARPRCCVRATEREGRACRLGGAGGRRLLHERQADRRVELGIDALRGVEHITGQTPGSRARLDEIEVGAFGDLVAIGPEPPHLGELLCQQLAKDRPDIDAGKKIARAPRFLGRAGVVTELGMVERELHELGEADRTARSDAIGDQLAELTHYCLRTVTNCSWPRRLMSMPTARPAGTARSAALASDALVTGLRFTCMITSPGCSTRAAGLS